jgi:cold-inducible RNA-binding protein
MKLYVGNLPWKVDDDGLKEMFASYGVDEATLIRDKFSKRSKGFGFVTISDEASAKKAISEMDKKDIEGRPLTVSEARPMVRRDGDDRSSGSSESSESAEAPVADPEAVEDAVEESVEAEEASEPEAKEEEDSEDKADDEEKKEAD